jgi:6-pyruvoyltetrahydropterin/6-carboxytetrahydropterin synthase
MFEISVQDRFHAHHHLRMPDGTVESAHAHDWQVTVTVAGSRLDAHGLLVDFGVVRRELRDLLSTLEGADLNGVVPLDDPNPSAEVVARYVAKALVPLLPGEVYVRAVAVEEEPGCVARYLPPSRG